MMPSSLLRNYGEVSRTSMRPASKARGREIAMSIATTSKTAGPIASVLENAGVCAKLSTK